MSVAIKNALKNLDKSIDRMEGTVVSAAKRPKSPKSTSQNDLFAAATTPVQNAGTVVNFDRNALARQLDKTIARVEQLLGEA